MPEVVSDHLADGELEVLGRIMPASNQTFLVQVGPPELELRAVYKPVAGERPLWDFEDGTLAARERAAYLISEALGWRLVPRTLLREGPSGLGMVQEWCEPDPGQRPVDIVPAGEVPTGYRHVTDAFDQRDRPVALVHEDAPVLRRMALFDVVVNNTDRKGGHVLAMPDGHRYGVDHGVCFHVEDKLRTVLWGWAGEPLAEDEGIALSLLLEALAGETGSALEPLLTPEEIDAARVRAERLLDRGRFPLPSAEWPSLPWPAF